jgi:hypothetical protein
VSTKYANRRVLYVRVIIIYNSIYGVCMEVYRVVLYRVGNFFLFPRWYDSFILEKALECVHVEVSDGGMQHKGCRTESFFMSKE